MKTKITAKNRRHLDKLIEAEIREKGANCNLNHIDVSLITEMHFLFAEIGFNGDISEWDVSQVEHMDSMFSMTVFNGDISKWDVSNLKTMGDMFYMSEFKGDLSNWKPYSLEKLGNAFLDCEAEEPYWVKFETKEDRANAIKKYVLHNELNNSLKNNDFLPKKTKI